MDIYGLQKLTLLDYPGKVACTVFLSGCNFRCLFCHNTELAEGKTEPVMDDAELLSFLSKRKGILEGVAVTGGEPLMSEGLTGLLRGIKELGFPVKLDTDGAFPERLSGIISEGLADYIAMDIKNSPEKYPHVCGTVTVPIENIKKSINIIMETGIEYEFRTTVVPELMEDKDFSGIGEMIKGAEKYYLQAFKDRETVRFSGFTEPSEKLLRHYAVLMSDYVKFVGIRGV